MSEALAKVDNSGADLIRSFEDLNKLGTMASKSGMFKDIKDAGQAVIKILAGRELGIGPMASLRGLHVFNGKVEASAGLIASKIKTHGRYNYRVIESTSERCEIEWFESGEAVGKSSFSMEEARKAKLADKDVWKNYATDMLFARALTRGQRKYAPDVFEGSIYVTGEVSEAVDSLDAENGVSPEEGERIQLLTQMRTMWLEGGATSDAWAQLCRDKLDAQSIAQLRKFREQLEAKLTKKREEAQATTVSSDDMLASIEREKNTLRLELVQENEIQEKVMKITSGEVLEDCTAEVLGDVLLYLQNWAEKLKPLTKTA